MFFKNDKHDPSAKGTTRTLPLLPLRDIIVFPHMVVPLFVGREKSHQRARGGDGAATRRSSSPRRRSAKTNDPTRGGHLRGRHGRAHHPAAAPARRHGEGAGRGQAARAHHAASSRPTTSSWSRSRRSTSPTSARVEVEALMRSVQSDVRELRQAQQAHPARDADQRADHRRPGAARRHDRRARLAQAQGQAGAPRDCDRRRSGSSASTS